MRAFQRVGTVCAPAEMANMGVCSARLGDRKAERIGEYTRRVRGLPGARFLSLGTAGYTIVSFTDEVRRDELEA